MLQKQETQQFATNAQKVKMAQVGLTKAAKITGKAASTITRRTKHKEASKRLGFILNGDGEKLYDVAELERVFGTLKPQLETTDSNDNAIARNSKNATQRNNLQQQLSDANQEKNALLQDKIDLLHTQLDDMRLDRDEWREQAKQSTRLLEDHTKQQKKSPENTTEKKKGFWGSLFG